MSFIVTQGFGSKTIITKGYGTWDGMLRVAKAVLRFTSEIARSITFESRIP